MATIVNVIGNQLKLDGSFSPRWGGGDYQRLLHVLSLSHVVSIRLSQIDFSKLDQAFVTLLGTVLKSRVWNRIYLTYCGGILSDTCLQGLLMTKQLEIYGSMLNLLPALGHAMSTNTTVVECLKLRTRFQQDSMTSLAEGIKSSKLLKKLYLTCAFEDAISANSLAMSLAENQWLELLSLYSCEFHDEISINHILTALQNHPKLVTLELRDNNASGTAALSTLVRHTTTIESLDLFLPPRIIQQTQVSRFDSESFSIALQENTSLKSLALANNALSTPHVVCLSKALRSNKTLHRLNLQGNLITDEAIQVLADCLPEMSLKELW
jgi:hypothetical protein